MWGEGEGEGEARVKAADSLYLFLLQAKSQVQRVTNNIPLLLRFISDKVYPLCGATNQPTNEAMNSYGNIALFSCSCIRTRSVEKRTSKMFARKAILCL